MNTPPTRSLMSDQGGAAHLLKHLSDAIPEGPHHNPLAEWVMVRLDVVQTAIDHIEWQDAARAALEDTIFGATLELTAGLEYVQKITTAPVQEVSYETMQRSGFRPGGWQRRYTLADARRHSETAEIRLRNAWELLDPCRPTKHAEAKRTALANAQDALQTAINHLQAVLNKPRTHDEQQRADTAARDWLISIGSEPSL